MQLSSLGQELNQIVKRLREQDEHSPRAQLDRMFRQNDPLFFSRAPAAVCVLFQGEQLQDSRVLLTLRSDRLATHASQVAFPGGSMDPEDAADPVRTAARECFEEVGVDPNHWMPHGVLQPFPTLGGHFLVHPVVASWSAVPVSPFSLQADEVVQAEWVSVSELLRSQTFEDRSLFGHPVKAPVFLWGEHKMWGLSAWIFHSILTQYANLKT